MKMSCSPIVFMMVVDVRGLRRDMRLRSQYANDAVQEQLERDHEAETSLTFVSRR